MALETHDLSLVLASLADRAIATRVIKVGGFDTLIARIPAGERYEYDATTTALLLVLEGVGTLAIDDWRASLAGGHLVNVPAQARLVVTADGDQTMSLLMTRPATSATLRKDGEASNEAPSEQSGPASAATTSTS